VAIKQLDSQSDQGAFHFIDNYNRFLVAIGRICNDLISKVDAGPRQVMTRTKDNKDKLVWVNKPYTDESGETVHHDMTLGEYDVTIGVEQTEDSQREAASDFLETLIQELAGLQEDPAKKDALLALSIEAKQLGPIGDQMVKILQPPQGDPAQAQQQLQQLQSQLQQLQTENAALHEDRAKRQLEADTKVQIKNMEIEAKGAADAAQHQNEISLANLQLWAKLVVAEMQKQSRSTDLLAEQDASRLEQALGAAHDAGMQAVEHEHEKALATQQAATAAQTQASDQVHQQTMAEQQAQQPDAGGGGQ
jgi:hypothetical protein